MNYFLLIITLLTTLLFSNDKEISSYIKKYDKEKKCALIIANGKYGSSSVRNAKAFVNNARLIKKFLNEKQFDVLYRENVTASEIESLLKEFKSRSKKATTGIIYYSGYVTVEKNRNSVVGVKKGEEKKYFSPVKKVQTYTPYSFSLPKYNEWGETRRWGSENEKFPKWLKLIPKGAHYTVSQSGKKDFYLRGKQITFYGEYEKCYAVDYNGIGYYTDEKDRCQKTVLDGYLLYGVPDETDKGFHDISLRTTDSKEVYRFNIEVQTDKVINEQNTYDEKKEEEVFSLVAFDKLFDLLQKPTFRIGAVIMDTAMLVDQKPLPMTKRGDTLFSIAYLKEGSESGEVTKTLIEKGNKGLEIKEIFREIDKRIGKSTQKSLYYETKEPFYFLPLKEEKQEKIKEKEKKVVKKPILEQSQSKVTINEIDNLSMEKEKEESLSLFIVVGIILLFLVVLIIVKIIQRGDDPDHY